MCRASPGAPGCAFARWIHVAPTPRVDRSRRAGLIARADYFHVLAPLPRVVRWSRNRISPQWCERRRQFEFLLVGVVGVNRAELQQLAEDRILDAQALLAVNRWSGAYYLAGYAVECARRVREDRRHESP